MLTTYIESGAAAVRRFPTVDLSRDCVFAHATGVMHIQYHVPHTIMVETTEREDMIWYRCEECGLLFDVQEEAEQHEAHCDAEEPAYIQ